MIDAWKDLRSLRDAHYTIFLEPFIKTSDSMEIIFYVKLLKHF